MLPCPVAPQCPPRFHTSFVLDTVLNGMHSYYSLFFTPTLCAVYYKIYITVEELSHILGKLAHSCPSNLC